MQPDLALAIDGSEKYMELNLDNIIGDSNNTGYTNSTIEAELKPTKQVPASWERELAAAEDCRFWIYSQEEHLCEA
jgi:hypothetical protein